jgi:hypothetical protein
MQSAFTRLDAEPAAFPLHEFSPLRPIFLALDGLRSLGPPAKFLTPGQPSLAVQPHAYFVLQARAAE